MLDMKNQYKPDFEIYHSVNIVGDSIEYLRNYDYLFDDLIDNNLIINFNKNSNQHENYIKAIIGGIKTVKYEHFDVFIKIDDDDLYKRNYIRTIVDEFDLDNTIDIVSSNINTQLNGCHIYRSIYTNLGANPPNYDFSMPMTFAFNKKALYLYIREIAMCKTQQVTKVINKMKIFFEVCLCVRMLEIFFCFIYFSW
jgi:hypothetical protein